MPLPKLLRLPVSTNRIFGLDLLRAFAIIIVMLGHGTTYVSHKFAFYYTYILRFDGVNLFFVLSGFLIGGILIRTLETKTASVATLWSFWVKRWIRTVPPYLLALVLVIVLQRIVWSPPPLRDYAAHFFFLQNLNWPGPKLYQEAWSLAVEEWFYLLSAPCVFVLAALRLKPQAAIVVTALTIIVLTVAHRYYYFLHTPPHTLLEWAENFRGIVLMRLDSLMYGMLAAYFAYYHKQGWLKYKGVKFAVGLAWLYLSTAPSLEAFTTLSLPGCVFSFVGAGISTALLLPLLSSWKSSSGPVASAITHISLISYSMYLLHSSILNNNIILPLIHALHLSQQVGAFVGMGLFWGLTLVLATLMYKYFEVPVMALRNKLTATEPTKVLV